MKNFVKSELKTARVDAIGDFSLPRYKHLPTVGLYLDQATKYINACIAPLGCDEVTSSMVRNYVKQGLVANPVKKLYYDDQIAHLLAIALLKQVTPLENIRRLFALQEKVYSVEVAYNYFCMELENILYFRFGLKDSIDDVGVTSSMEKEMLRSAIVAVTHIIYLNACFEGLGDGESH